MSEHENNLDPRETKIDRLLRQGAAEQMSDPPSSLHGSVMSRIEATKRPATVRHLSFRTWAPIAGTAMAAAAMIALVVWLSGAPTPSNSPTQPSQPPIAKESGMPGLDQPVRTVTRLIGAPAERMENQLDREVKAIISDSKRFADSMLAKLPVRISLGS